MPYRFRVLLITLLIVAATKLDACVFAQQPNPDAPSFVKGYSWGWVGRRGEYSAPAAAESMKKLAETGCEWVCIAFSTAMRTADDPVFFWGEDSRLMASDDDLRTAIALARENNLKVILKPVINVRDGTWRAWIKFFRPLTDEEKAAGHEGVTDPWGEEWVERTDETVDLEKWDTWWKNFEGFLTHYAEIAAEQNVELFCVGCEMNSTEEFEDRWRSVIGQVREKYQGPIVYDINHGRENELSWWDAVDVMGISGYYPVSPPEGVEVEAAIQTTTPKSQIITELEKVRDQLAAVHQRWQKPILFIETGVTSVRGCARYPWTHPGAMPDSPTDLQEQANYYAAFFEVFWDQPWFIGYAWWDWPARLYPADRASTNRGFCAYGKPAEAVLREWYAKPSPR